MTITVVPDKPNREEKIFSLRETFGIETSPLLVNGEVAKTPSGDPIYKDVEIRGFAQPGPMTPKINPSYVFPKYELTELLAAMQSREPTYLLGHSGTGKTALATQVAARLNYNVIQINFDGHLSRADLIGEWRLVGNGDMAFRYGLVPIAFTEPGTMVLFDEIDACPPETAFVLQRAISEDLKFLMHETNELIQLHPQNCIVGTANTNGLGDESSLYMAGTNVQNFSFLNRWSTVITIDYLSKEDERKVLESMFPDAVCAPYITPVTQVLAAVRTSFQKGSVSMPLTTRDGINWLTKIKRCGHPMRAARFSFLDKLPKNDALSIANIIARYIKLTPRDDMKYVTSAVK